MSTIKNSEYVKVLFTVDDIKNSASFSAYYYKSSDKENLPVIINDIDGFKSIIAKLKDHLKLFIVIHIGGKIYLDDQAQIQQFATYPCEPFLKTLNSTYPGIKYVLSSRAPKQADEEHFKQKIYKPEYVLDLEDNLPFQYVHDLTGSVAGRETLTFKPENIIAKTESVEPKLAIITALAKDEYESFKDHMYETKDQGNIVCGKFMPLKNYNDDYNIPFFLLSQHRMGMVDAALTTHEILYKINPEVIIMAGVCGGREREAKLYDIIIPNKVIDIITGKYKTKRFIPYGFTEPIDEHFIKFLDESDRKSQIKNRMLSMLADNVDNARKRAIVNDIDFKFDTMACGAFVLKTKNFLETKAQQMDDKIVGFEMESYGVMRSVKLFKKTKSAIIIKSVMDYTDENKVDVVNGEPIKHMAAFMSYLATRAIMPLIEEYLNMKA